MSNSPSNVFLVLNEVLEGVEVEQVQESKTMQKMRVLSKERAEIQGEIHEKLKRKGVRFDTTVVKSESSFAVTEIPIDDDEGKYKIRLVYKKKGGGGSGAGAALTKLSESAQCMYAALAWMKNGKITNQDVTCENFNDRAVKSKTLTDEKYEAMCNDLPDEWINSCIEGANKLKEVYSGNYTFHRGSPMVNQIEGHFKRIKRLEGVRMDLNKWSPADIYLIRKDFDIGCLAKEKTILGLNACMQRELSDGKLIGVSLKKITGNARLKAMNQSGTAPEVKYDGFELSPDSMDGYLKVKVAGSAAKIQFRSFGGNTSLTGWQGEVKGASANQGKISYGPINLILKNHSVTQIRANAAQDAKRNDDAVATQIAKGMIELGALSGKTKDHVMMIKSKSDKWRYSKLQVVQLLSTIKSLSPEKRNQVMEDLFLYASSQSQYSAPYMKME
jgi:hypothetical protein|tara:strand:- start:231 stop:1562 length:1332 start_codon:yes stop_codon:yes gene_type:complete